MMKRSRFHTCPEPGEAIAPPLLVSIKAQDDTATGWGFHVGHYLESFDKSFRDYDEGSTLSVAADPKVPAQRSAFERTVGSFNYYHNYCYIEPSYKISGDPVCDRIALKQCQPSESVNRSDQANPQNRGANVQAFSLKLPMTSKSRFTSACDSSSPLIGNLFTRYDPVACARGHCDVWNDTPYWIFTV